MLEALAATGRPGAAVSSTELAKRTGINRNPVRRVLLELRGKLGIAQEADLVQVARERGLLPDPAPERDAEFDPA